MGGDTEINYIDWLYETLASPVKHQGDHSKKDRRSAADTGRGRHHLELYKCPQSVNATASEVTKT